MLCHASAQLRTERERAKQMQLHNAHMHAYCVAQPSDQCRIVYVTISAASVGDGCGHEAVEAHARQRCVGYHARGIQLDPAFQRITRGMYHSDAILVDFMNISVEHVRGKRVAWK